MPKRKHSDEDSDNVLSEIIEGKSVNKNSLDSDEEDVEDDSEKYTLKDDDIEGQEDGVVGFEEGIQITPFNMNEELEEGHFDANGMYHWKKEKIIRDNWLENIDWIKVKDLEHDKKSLLNDAEMPEAVDTLELYKQILAYLEPKETIAKALKRLGGNKSLSASERLKLKKAGKSVESCHQNSDKITELTELANKILTAVGNMDIYQETYEYIFKKVHTSAKKNIDLDLDMYADDFEEKEKERLSGVSSNIKDNDTSHDEDIKWEYKNSEECSDINGPFSTEQMSKFSSSGHFKKGVLVRKCGTEQFYSLSRIDFDLYM